MTHWYQIGHYSPRLPATCEKVSAQKMGRHQIAPLIISHLT